MTTFTAYHGTNASFRRFDPKRGAQGIIWFSSDRETIERGESGAQGTARILELQVTIDRPAGWREYDQLMLDEIESRGFDGVILPRKDGFDGFVFDPSQIEIVKTKPRYHENPARLRPYVVRGRIWNGTSWDFVKVDVQERGEGRGVRGEGRSRDVSGPQYEPHGGRCEFLGRRRDYDLYVCTYEGYIDTVIARYGNELEDYKSGLVFALRGLDPDLVDALRRAEERGFEIQAGRFRDDR